MRTATEKFKQVQTYLLEVLPRFEHCFSFLVTTLESVPERLLRCVQECQIKKQDSLNRPVGQKH